MNICKVSKCTNKMYGSCGYCNKHYMQIRKYGEILSETIFDKNIIDLKDEYAEIVLKDRSKNEVNRALIDIEDVEKIRGIKWCLIGTNGYVRGNNKNGKDRTRRNK